MVSSLEIQIMVIKNQFLPMKINVQAVNLEGFVSSNYNMI